MDPELNPHQEAASCGAAIRGRLLLVQTFIIYLSLHKNTQEPTRERVSSSGPSAHTTHALGRHVLPTEPSFYTLTTLFYSGLSTSFKL